MTIDELKEVFLSGEPFSLSSKRHDYLDNSLVVFRFKGNSTQEKGLNGEWIDVCMFLDEMLDAKLIRREDK